MAGASETTLPKKLGVKDGHTVVVLGGPDHLERKLSSREEVRLTRQLRPSACDVVVLFVDRVAELERRIGDVVARMHPDGAFWVAWRARRSGDITEDVVRRIGLAAGLVDNKACDLDEVWSGVRLVIRAENREAMAYRIEPRAPLRLGTRRRLARATPATRVASGGGSTLRRARARSSR